MPKAYIVNTNKSNNANNELEMLCEGKVAAYYSPWKYFIDEMESNDIVFLYSNGRGIIARGMATGIVEIKNNAGGENNEHYMHLNRFQELETPLSSSTISELVKEMTDENYKIFWNQTMIHIPGFVGEHIWRHISRNCMR
ncbi:hypothetical protein [Rossellomorea vietnamensis]|uniref:hypothetical protein n=1 Tax=Rossellomorea vietnamensis TaxID=218284 RepID=UPI003D28E6BB